MFPKVTAADVIKLGQRQAGEEPTGQWPAPRGAQVVIKSQWVQARVNGTDIFIEVEFKEPMLDYAKLPTIRVTVHDPASFTVETLDAGVTPAPHADSS